MRGPDFFLTFGDEDEIYGKFFVGGAKGMQRGEKGRFGAFLVYRAAAHQNLAQAWFIDEGGIEWRRGPLGGVGLFYVVHKIKAEGAGSAGIEGSENAGLAIGGNLGDAVEAGIAQQAHGEIATFVHATIFRGDGGLADPFLQAVYGFVMALFNFGAKGVDVAGGARPTRPRERRSATERASGRALQKAAPVYRRNFVRHALLQFDFGQW